MLVHTLVNQKYVAFFAFIVVLITNAYIWGPAGCEQQYGSVQRLTGLYLFGYERLRPVCEVICLVPDLLDAGSRPAGHESHPVLGTWP